MPAIVDVQAPYPGLRPFQSHEAEIFFGREQHTDRLLEILQRERFLAVIGPSGCGKSSLVRAGMLVALAAGWLGTGTTWRIAIMRPGGRPFRRLAEALLDPEVFGPELGDASQRPGAGTSERADTTDTRTAATSRIEAELNRGPRGLKHLVADVRRMTQGDQAFNLLLLVDQFEELFTYATPDDPVGSAEAFVDLLLTSRADAGARIYVGLTMRTDFLGHCVKFMDLPEAINRAQCLIPRLKRPELLRAIAAPAGLFGGEVDQSLTEELVNKISGTQDELPVLQHVMSRMWELARVENQVAPTAAWKQYEQVGGVAHALSRHADAIFESLSEENRKLAEVLFTCITERRSAAAGGQEVRRPQSLEQIGRASQVSWELLVPVVEHFSGEGVHFLHPIDKPAHAGAIVDISHEALIRQWDRLRRWVRDEADRAADYRRWRRRAIDRERGGELLVGADLVRAIEWREGVRDPNGSSLWRPTPVWARRYASGVTEEEASSEFDSVLNLIGASEEAEHQRVAAARAAADRSRQLDRERLEALARAAEASARAAEAEARIERERAEAAARQKAEAENHAELYRRQKLEAEELARLAEDRASEAMARQLATEALQSFTDDPDRAQLLAVRACNTAPLAATELVLRQAFVRGEGLICVLRGHRGPVERAAFSADERIVITVGHDRTVRLWDARTGENVAILHGHSGPVASAVTSHGGASILMTGGDGSVRVWNATSGRLDLEIPAHPTIAIDGVFAPDDVSILTAARDMTVRRWHAKTGALLETLELDSRLHSSDVTAGAFSPDGQRILTASTDRTARLWSAATQELLVVLRGHEDILSHAVFDSHGLRIATASEDGTARLWDAASGKQLAILAGHSGKLSHLAFSPNGERLVTGGHDGTARIWDTGTGRELLTLRGTLPDQDDSRIDAVLHVAFSPSGDLVATASHDETARIWQADSGREIAVLLGHTDIVSFVSFSPDGSRFLTVSWDGTAILWDAVDGDAVAILSGDGSALTCAAFHPTGEFVFGGDAGGTVRQWAARTGALHASRRQHSKKITRVAFSPNGRSILIASHDRSISIWELVLDVTTVVIDHPKPVLDGCFSPDGLTILTTCGDGVRAWSVLDESLQATIGRRSAGPTLATSAVFSADTQLVAWSTDEGRLALSKVETGLATHVLHEPELSSQGRVRFSHDGTALLAIGDDGAVRVWRTADHRRTTLIREAESAITRASFSHDGGSILTASADGFVRAFEPVPSSQGQSLPRDASAADRWSQSTSTVFTRMQGQADVTCIAISPDNSTATFAGQDGIVRFCERHTGLLRGVLTGHNDAVIDASFADSGDALVTASRDGTARIWRTNVGAPIAVLSHDGGKLRVAQFSPDGSLILTVTQDQRARLWSGDRFQSSLELTGQGGAVSSASFSVDGTRVLTASTDGSARLWDVSSGLEMESVADPRRSAGIGIAPVVTFSPDGGAWLIACEDGRVHVGSTGTLTPRLSWDCHDDAVLDARVDPTGTLIATASKDGTARIWNAADGRMIGAFEHDGAVVSVAFSPDRSMLATASDRTARLWNLDPTKTPDPAKPPLELRGHTARVVQVAFSPNGRTVATASGDGSIRIWDAVTGQALRTLKGHRARITRIAYSPDGSRLATASADCKTILWETAGEAQAVLFAREEPVTYVEFSADGRLTLTANQDGDVHLWDTATGSMIRTLVGHRAAVRKAIFSQSGRVVVSISHDRTARLWAVHSGENMRELIGHTDALLDVAMTRDERYLLTTSLDATTRLWDATAGTQIAIAELRSAPDAEGTIVAEFLGTSSSALLTVGSGLSAVWDTSPARVRTTLEGARSNDGTGPRMVCSALSRNGRLVASGGDDGITRIWDTTTGACVIEWSAPRAEQHGVEATETLPSSAPSGNATVNCMAFSPDGRLIVTAHDRSAFLWEPTTGNVRAALRGHEEPILFAAFSKDGSRLATASADKTARIWNVTNGERLVTLRGHANAVTHLVFNHDGRTIATASHDHAATVWDVATGRMLISLRGHRGPVTSVDFNPDGTLLATTSDDGTARVWSCQVSAPPGVLASHIRRRVGRDLTAEETMGWAR